MFLFKDPLAAVNRAPVFAFNYSIDNELTIWQHVQTKTAPPVCIPPNVRFNGAGMIIVRGPPQPLVAGALRNGLKLNLTQLDDLLGELGVPRLAAGTGSGKKNVIVKKDKARALIEFVFPGESETETTRMVNAIMGKANKTQQTDPLLLEAAASIPVEEAAAFSKVIKDCIRLKNKMDKEKQKKQQATPAASAACPDTQGPDTQADDEPALPRQGPAGVQPEYVLPWKSYTPECLALLLPGRHALPYVYLRRIPYPGTASGRYTGVYQSCLN